VSFGIRVLVELGSISWESHGTQEDAQADTRDHVEEPTPEQEVPLKSIGKKDLEAQEDHGD
jgi:hypothetical protein